MMERVSVTEAAVARLGLARPDVLLTSALAGGRWIDGGERLPVTDPATGEVLRRRSEAILADREDLARLMTAEQGKPLAEARSEVTYAAGFVEWFGKEAKRVRGDTMSGQHRRARRDATRRSSPMPRRSGSTGRRRGR